MAAKSGSKRYPLARPSKSDEKREMAATKTSPPGRTTRRASANAPTLSLTFGEVVHGPEYQRDVNAVAGYGEVPGIADLGGDTSRSRARCRHGADLFDLGRHEVHDVDGMAVGRQPPRMHPGSAPHIQDLEISVGQVTTNDLLGPQQLEASQPVGDATTLVDLPVVLEDLGRHGIHGRRS